MRNFIEQQVYCLTLTMILWQIMQRVRRFLLIILVLGLSGVLPAESAHAQGANGIHSPRGNAVVSGVVLIEGSATDPSFLRYELAFFKEFDPQGDWVVFATGERPVVNGVLATWDTTIGRDAGAPFYQDGTYRLRLRVVRQDSNYDEFFVLGISIANESATPTPTDAPETAASPVPTSALALPTELPTLTPFPTATPRPTAKAGEPPPAGPESEGENSFLNFEGEFSSEQVRSGLRLGVSIALVFFVALAAYGVFRNVLRRLLPWLSRK